MDKNSELIEFGGYDDPTNDCLKTFIRKNGVLVPIAAIGGKEDLFLVGSIRAFIKVGDDGETPEIRVADGHEPLSDFLAKNGQHFKRVIVAHMNNSGLSYAEVVDGIRDGKKKFANISES